MASTLRGLTPGTGAEARATSRPDDRIRGQHPHPFGGSDSQRGRFRLERETLTSKEHTSAETKKLLYFIKTVDYILPDTNWVSAKSAD